MHNGFQMLDAPSAPEAARPILGQIAAEWGMVPNLHRVLAASPAALEAYAALWNIVEKTDFTAVERNIAYLAIIAENECEYCMAGHSGLSKRAGVAAADIAALRAGSPLADPRLEALRGFAQLLVRRRGVVSPAEVTAFLDAGFERRHVLDLLVIAATKLISNYTNHIAGTPNDAFMAGMEWTRPGRLQAHD